MGRIRASHTGLAPGAAGQPAIDAAQDAALANWGRWSAVRAGVRVQPGRVAAGLSGAVVAQQGAADAAVDADAAWQVEKTVCSALFLPRCRAVLTAHYVHRHSKAATCRTLGIEWSAYEVELWRAVQYFQGRMRKNEVTPY